MTYDPDSSSNPHPGGPSSSRNLHPNKEFLKLSLNDSDTFTHIALVNEGACMNIVYKVYYTVCPNITSNLAMFAESHTPAEVTQHKEV